MFALRRGKKVIALTCLIGACTLFFLLDIFSSTDSLLPKFGPQSFNWKHHRQHHPVQYFIPLPPDHGRSLPQIQHTFPTETAEEEAKRLFRRSEVRKSFEHAWAGYREHAWGEDELLPKTGGSRSAFGGWAATLVDSLDTLWIMGMKEEFKEAVNFVVKIDFSQADIDVINVFETTIRFLGGLLSAFDLSGERALLRKAIQLGDMLYAAFDTPNHMPISRWHWKDSRDGIAQSPGPNAVSAEVGSYSLEFTRLTQFTGDPKYYDVVQRVTDALRRQQNDTRLPGMWPLTVDPMHANFTEGYEFSVSAMADSLYEYLPKEHMLLGGGRADYLQMYSDFLATARRYIFYRAKTPLDRPIRFAGRVHVYSKVELIAEAQHLGCFIGGTVALGARLRGAAAGSDGGEIEASELALARELTDGCIWAYSATPSGIMPEVFKTVECYDDKSCKWTEVETDKSQRPGETKNVKHQNRRGNLPPGFSSINDRTYQLRPEAIESVFTLYRVTGDRTLQDQGWDMFRAVERATRTDYGHTEISDVTVANPPQLNKMESFWTAETLKYYYLLFSEPELVSLDRYVFNTEAHPLRYR